MQVPPPSHSSPGSTIPFPHCGPALLEEENAIIGKLIAEELTAMGADDEVPGAPPWFSLHCGVQRGLGNSDQTHGPV